MATYELPYAEKHLSRLFQEARDGEDVIIVRFDGLSCQLLPIANVKEREPIAESIAFSDPAFGGDLVPA
jgi:antitoxin (DNA-binding transcriptional repressor) of toxin-antitoxin stability system